MDPNEQTDMVSIGSDELTIEEFTEHTKLFDKQVKLLYETAAKSDEARKFLNTSFGKSIIEVIATNKIIALQTCAKAAGEDLADAQLDYAVYEKVEQVFAIIIQGGEEALQSLKQMELH